MIRRFALALALLAHPLHSTHTLIRTGAGGRVEVTLRGFTEDLRRAVSAAEGAASDSALARYVGRRLRIQPPGAAPLVLRLLRRAVDGDATILTFDAGPGAVPRGARVRQAMLMELFDDQVNVVQLEGPAGSASLLFLAGDGEKRLD